MIVGAFPNGRPEILTSRDLETWLSVTNFIDPEQYHVYLQYASMLTLQYAPACKEYHVLNAPGIGFIVAGEKGDILVSDHGLLISVGTHHQVIFGELSQISCSFHSERWRT